MAIIEAKIVFLQKSDKSTIIKARIYKTEGPFDNPPDKLLGGIVTQYYKRSLVEEVEKSDIGLAELKAVINGKLVQAITKNNLTSKDIYLDF